MAGTNPAFAIGASVMTATSTTSVNIGLGSTGDDTAVVSNFSTGNLYVGFGGPAAVAVVNNGYVVLPNQQRTMACPVGSTNVCAVLDAGTGFAYVERGFGSQR